ncbi:uncharacterized protein LACBIDRAFT_336344 [Laccaria bicolor S238N-H82]|uniref:Predicted protein n=1 Tax=Laccaria bicolor (strain S238N-H82 / ATCC MYA-4686) TaxID=486041 RepID=B0E563_LACBS|nr:uncharacterized protein LACBIDRAFT_336344 [Laccaria bicolor S238N-H82]EDQ98017.1 predicted protein [Laccaria bicolor S238N-H82]|eukprot:XP_001891331.1 predicted protein [Laccaria bicolor S238N-H82]
MSRRILLPAPKPLSYVQTRCMCTFSLLNRLQRRPFNGKIAKIGFYTVEHVSPVSTANAEAFLQELGETEASFKTRSFNVVAYYVPLNLDANSEKDRGEIEEMNNIPKGALTKLRWIKPPARRRPDQRFAHVIATFSDAESANRAIVNGLSICHKRVSVAKCKKEPIRCLKCQGWDHIALECIIAKEVNVCAQDVTYSAEYHRLRFMLIWYNQAHRKTGTGKLNWVSSPRPQVEDQSPIAPPASSNGSPPPDSSTTQVIAHV